MISERDDQKYPSAGIAENPILAAVFIIGQ